jgi:hypothetical protein
LFDADTGEQIITLTGRVKLVLTNNKLFF